MRSIGLLLLCSVLLVVGTAARGQDELRYETKDWVFTAPSVLVTKPSDLELVGRATQICTDEIVRLTGHRPRTPAKFAMAWVIDGNPAGSYATQAGVVNHVPDASWRLVEDHARAYREASAARGLCLGGHEETHVLTWEASGPSWANEGLATLVGFMYTERPGWRCCDTPPALLLSCDAAGYRDALESRPYSDLSPFTVDWDSYRTAACFWLEIHDQRGLRAIRGMLAGMRTRPPRTTGELAAHAQRVLNPDVRPILSRYGFEPAELEATPLALTTCTLIGTAEDERFSGTRGPDRMCGLGGRDRITGGLGADVLEGGAGDDTLNARDGERDVVRGGSGRDTARIDRGLDRVTGVEQVRP